MSDLRATYRLQLAGRMDFARARSLVPYLRDLGITHLYLSPALQARSGSTHGYDVIDPTRVSRELGGEQGLRDLAAAGLGIVLDIVPNHMAIGGQAGEQNRWWADPQLRERFFDVDPVSGAWRRFFDVDELAGVRQEDPHVFDVTHAKVLELVRDGVLDGLRVDHPDGLADPAGYLRRLRERGARRVWVEKILHPGEALRDWPVQGTVGYEFLNDATALFVDPAGERALTELWVELADDRRSFAAVAAQAKLEQASGTFAREVERLERLAAFTADTLARGLAGLPVYRTYVEPSAGRVEDADRAAVVEAGMDPALARALVLDERAGVPDELVTRFQQTSPAVTAKGVEDTAFYRYLRLLALNDVGGDPARFGLSVEAFHAANAERARRFPHGLLATQTHDTKRSGDVRMRIGVLASVAGEWAERVHAWRVLNAALRDAGAPDPVEEYLIYQTLVGAWPIDAQRLAAYLEKALREAKRNSSWVQQDRDWEGRVIAFGSRLLEHGPFLEDFLPFCERVRGEGERRSLAQLLLQMTCPGVPDIFQGDELWRLSLVDPDNRRAVDWEERQVELERLRGGTAPTAHNMKLFFIWKVLGVRARRPHAFTGAYAPVPAGPDACAFMRGTDVLVAVPVRAGAAGAGELPAACAGSWRDALDGRVLELATGDPVARLWAAARRGAGTVLERVG